MISSQNATERKYKRKRKTLSPEVLALLLKTQSGQSDQQAENTAEELFLDEDLDESDLVSEGSKMDVHEESIDFAKEQTFPDLPDYFYESGEI